MEFKNRRVPEGINVSRHSPLADLALLGSGVLAGFALFAIALVMVGGALARFVPLSWETALAQSLFAEAEAVVAQEAGAPDRALAAREALRDLTARLSAQMELPEGMDVTVHYLEGDTVNAFASFGGHIFVMRGLIERLPNENALAMVLAHEIAHLANRDPAARMGGVVLLQLALSVVLGAAPDTLETVLRAPNVLLQSSFGRRAEARADAAALGAVAALYGHVAGAPALFEVLHDLQNEAGAEEPPEFLSDHPLNLQRIAAIEAQARERGWSLQGELTPLPPALAILKSGADS